MNDSGKSENKYAWLKVAGQCTFIPVYLALFPVAFYFVGAWLDELVGTTWLRTVFLFLGLFSGFRQTYFLIKKLIESQENDRGS